MNRPKKKRVIFIDTFKNNPELILWALISTTVVYPLLVSLNVFNMHDDSDSFFLRNYNHIMLSVITFLFPLIFKLIYGYYPLTYLIKRQKTNSKFERPSFTESKKIEKEFKNESIDLVDFRIHCINESSELAEKMLNKSNVYLLIGSFISISGLAIIYSKYLYTPSTSNDFKIKILDNLPRIGALLFIEFIAFFFLKQYRIMLEEYRYYEAIKRKRQDDFNWLNIIEKSKDDKDFLKSVLEVYQQSKYSNKLLKGESTETIETQKVLNQDMDILGKFIDFIKDLKK